MTSIPTAATPTELATMREWIGLGIIALPCMLYTMDLTILNLAVPAITRELMPSAAQLLWIVDIYGFIVAGSLLVMGTLGDRIGRRRLLMAGATSFALVSILAGLASNAPTLIAARALLGLAGATLAPSTLSLITSMFRQDRQRTLAVSIWIASFSFGASVGPVVGGILLAFFPWRVLFLVPVPVMLVLLVVGPRLLPEYRNPTAGRLDIASAVLSVATVLPVILGIKLLAEGSTPVLAAISALPGVACGVLFVRRQLTLEEPLLDLRLFRQFKVSAALGLNLVDFFLIFGIVLITTQYMQLVLGLSPLEAGLWSLPDGLGFVAGSLLTPVWLGLMRPAYVLCLGLTVGALGLFVMTLVGGPFSLYLLVAGITLFSVGLAPCATIIADLVVGSSPTERAGAASALNETSSELGGATGIALLGSLATYVYRTSFVHVVPGDLDEATKVIALRGIGAATEAASGLGASGSSLLLAARLAYQQAMQAGLLCACCIALCAAAAAFFLFRRQRKE